MRIIDADELLKKEKTIHIEEVGYTHRSIDPLDVIEAPTVEAEPIVRCKACYRYDGRYCITPTAAIPRHEDWWCADGELGVEE